MDRIEDWLDEMARAIGEEPITPDETAGALELARDVAHGVERKVAPLAAYLAGVQVGRRGAAGADRAAAFRVVRAIVAPLVPPDPAAPPVSAAPPGPPGG